MDGASCYKSTKDPSEVLDKLPRRSKIPGNSGVTGSLRRFWWDFPDCMTPKPPSPSQSVDKRQPCKHPRVQIVSRDEDGEFVECKECGEIFESSEFKDMNREESNQEEGAQE
jgi:hypothetical protein